MNDSRTGPLCCGSPVTIHVSSFIRHSPLKRDRSAFGTRHSGFTLIELLVVIAIISILASLLLPTLKQARDQAKTVQCLSQIKQVTLAFLLYAGENNDTLPPLRDFDDLWNETKYWQRRIHSYMGFPTNATLYVGYNIFRCPSAPVADASTYGVNYRNGPTAPIIGYESSLGNPSFVGSARLGRLLPATAIIMDATDSYVNNPTGWGFDTDADGDGVLDSCSALGADVFYNRLAPRHNRAAVFGIADGSARRVRTADWARDDQQIWGF